MDRRNRDFTPEGEEVTEDEEKRTKEEIIEEESYRETFNPITNTLDFRECSPLTSRTALEFVFQSLGQQERNMSSTPGKRLPSMKYEETTFSGASGSQSEESKQHLPKIMEVKILLRNCNADKSLWALEETPEDTTRNSKSKKNWTAKDMLKYMQEKASHSKPIESKAKPRTSKKDQISRIQTKLPNYLPKPQLAGEVRKWKSSEVSAMSGPYSQYKGKSSGTRAQSKDCPNQQQLRKESLKRTEPELGFLRKIPEDKA